jgi:hypothetical protein
MKIRSRYLLILVPVLLFAACSPQPCYQETYASVKAYFYVTGTGAAGKADTVTLYAVGRDTSKIYDNSKSLKSISFPLDASADSCRLILKLNHYTDTITLYYRSYVHLLSKECGYTFYHVLTGEPRHTNSNLDYLIINRNITTVNEENIRIFY